MVCRILKAFFGGKMSEGLNRFKKQVSSSLGKNRFSFKSIVALILFGAIILVFVLFGFPNRMNNQGGGTMGAAAQVNDALISLIDLRSESTRMEQMYAPLFGGQSIGDAQRQFLRQQALETLIVQELAAQSAKKAGVLATDAEIQDAIIHEIPAFQQNGRFQRDLYREVLQANYLNPVDFENKLRKERINVRTQRLFEAAAQPLQMEIEKLQALRGEKLNVAFARLDKNRALNTIKVSDAEVQSRLSKPEFAAKVQEFYNANKGQYSIEPQVRAQHILIKTDKDDAKAKQKIQEIRQKAQTEDFAKLATQYSEDSGTKVKGGDLGFFGRGAMVPEFDKAAFQQKIGEVGEPVRSQFGYHLIKVLEKKEGREKPFEEVRQDIAKSLIATEVYDSHIKAIEQALAKNDAAAVEAKLKEMGITWEETGFFDLSADSVPKLQSPEASKAALTLSESKPLFPDLVRDGSERYVLRLKSSKKEAASPESNLSAQLARERASDLFRTWIEDLKKSADIERNMEAVMSGR